MMNELVESAWELNYGKSIPKQRFFTPNERFWHELKMVIATFAPTMFIDCGTGNGDLPIESRDEGIKMAGVDIIHREGNGPVDVQIVPAHRMPFNDKIWPIVCRPDHSGWVQPLWCQAMASGAGFIYVGREAALENDVGETPFEPVGKIDGVGEEGECMVVWQPEDL